MSGRHQPRAVARSERAYGRLVTALYPKDFRRHYAPEMLLAFRQLCREAYGRDGRRGIARTWRAELRPLLAGAMWERSAAMKRTVAAGGRLGACKVLMTANTTLLVFFGVALVFTPVDLALGYGFLEPSQVPSWGAPDEAWSALLSIKVTMQALGATLIGLGGLVIAAAAHMRTRLGTRLPGALAAGHALLALAFAHIVLQFPSAPAWATTWVAATFAVGYAVFGIAETRKPGERSPAAGLDCYAQGA